MYRTSLFTAVPRPGKFGAHVVTTRHSKRSSRRSPLVEVSGPGAHAVRAAAPPTPARKARRFISASRGRVEACVLIADQSVRAQSVGYVPHCGGQNPLILARVLHFLAILYRVGKQ